MIMMLKYCNLLVFRLIRRGRVRTYFDTMRPLEIHTLNYESDRKNRALIKAAGRADHNHMDLLILAGADVDSTSSTGYTALMHAVENNEVKCIKILIEAGANLNKKNNWGGTAPDLALETRSEIFIDTLIKAGVDAGLALLNTIEKCDWTVVSQLLNSGASVNTLTSLEQQKLHAKAQICLLINL